MADISVTVLTPAETYDLCTLDEVKTMLGIALTDTSEDALLQMWITAYSDMIATMCNRTFAYEEVIETWRGDTKPFDTDNGRIFLSHYPVDPADIETVTGPDGTDLSTGYELEGKSGKLQFFNICWGEPIRIQYSGGYILPDEAPPALKQALGIAVQIARVWQSRGMTAGVRSISHRESRVQFFDIFQELNKMGGPGPIGVVQSMMKSILFKYMRFPA
jgi:hypothetical protein